MIKSLSIEGFKSFRNAHITFAQLNVLSGLNSSGKSSVIQSIRILDRVARKKDNVLLEELGEEKDIRNEHEPVLDISASYGTDKEKVIKYSCLSEDNKDFPKVIYVGADRIGPQDIYRGPNSHDLDPHGENVLKCIEYYSNLSENELPESLKPEDCEGEGFRFVVQGWLKQISPGVKFNVIKIEGIDAHKATYNNFSPFNVGYGLSYSLSIIVAVLMGVKEKNSIVLLENPEAHIHAKGQTAFADLICRAVDAGAQVVVETHSDHVFDGVRIYAKNHSNFASKTNVLWFKLAKDEDSFDNSFHTTIDNPKLDDNGKLDFWPVDMYDQFMTNSSKLL